MSFTLLDTPLVGLEDLQRAAFYVFFEGMENALSEIASYWSPRDQIFAERIGQQYEETTIEPIESKNFYEGHKPSLLLGTPDSYPNLSVFATRAIPAAESDRFDQMDSWAVQILVEVMVKALDEETVNRRCQRTAEAAVMCIRRNPDLGGATNGIMSAPSIDVGDVFAVRSPGQGGGGYQSQSGDGGRYIWQGASINFRIQKDSVLPSSGPGTFSSASQVDYSGNIDQG